MEPKMDLKLASKPQTKESHILATNHVEAIKVWIQQFKDTPTTLRGYQKEAIQLLWCGLNMGLRL